MYNFMFSVECRQINLLPAADNITYSYSTYDSSYSTADVWCAHTTTLDSSPNVNMTFTEPLYLLYFVARGRDTYEYYVTNFSLIYENPSGESVTYTNVDGYSVRQFIKCGL